MTTTRVFAAGFAVFAICAFAGARATVAQQPPASPPASADGEKKDEGIPVTSDLAEVVFELVDAPY